jgi:hypothetical protein
LEQTGSHTRRDTVGSRQITADCKGFEKLEAETVQWMEIKLGNEIEEYSNKNLYNQSR